MGKDLRHAIRMLLRAKGWTAGIGIGLVATLATGRMVEALLFGLPATDRVTTALAIVLMMMVSAVAGYLPARRASRVDPMVALHYE
jgi:ABC-type antimicrobial peptide transport system permease subunit